MISLAFINGEEEPIIANDPYIQFQSLLYESSCEIDNMIKSLIDKSNSIYMESEIMGSIDNEKLVVMEAEKSNVFEKLGNIVIAAFEKLNKLIQTVLDKIKAFFTKDKNELDKVETLIKKHPKLKDEVILAWRKNDLKVADAKSLKEMEDTFIKIIKMAKDDNIDPNTLQGKINAFKKRFEKIDESSTVKLARSISTVIAAAVAVVGFTFIFKDSQKRINDLNESNRKNQEAFLDAYERLQRNTNGEYMGGNLTKAQMLKNLKLFMDKNTAKMIKNDEGRIDKCNKSLLYFLNKHWKKEANDYISNMNTASNIKTAEKLRSNQEEVEQARKIKEAQLQAENDFKKNNP